MLWHRHSVSVTVFDLCLCRNADNYRFYSDTAEILQIASSEWHGHHLSIDVFNALYDIRLLQHRVHVK